MNDAGIIARLRLRMVTRTKKGDLCWEWIGQLDRDGYGIISFKGKGRKAHRMAYWLHYGLIDPSLTIDHLCRNRRCVRPDHLELVSNRINQLRGYGISGVNARKSLCKRGHALEGANLLLDPMGRHCRQCKSMAAKMWVRNPARPFVGEYCRHGHKWLPETTYINKKGCRVCALCIRRRGTTKTIKEVLV